MLAIDRRCGPRPTTHYGLPHQQLDQNPSREIYEALLARFLATPDTTSGPSLVSVPGARALFLCCERPCNESAFLRGREFVHVHPPEDGSFHMILAPHDCKVVLAAGWGELHPMAAAGQFHPHAMMVYAPRDEAEVETVLAIVSAAKHFAMTPSEEVQR
jgi:hypothetical protein